MRRLGQRVGGAAAILSLLAAASAAHAASPGCLSINADTLRLQADARRIGSSADRAQAIDCLAVGFNGGCFGRTDPPVIQANGNQASRTYDLAAGELIEFSITKPAARDTVRIVVVEPATAEIVPLEGTTYRVVHSGGFRFELAASGNSGQAAVARAICVPASS